jgi:hypothetical protein
VLVLAGGGAVFNNDGTFLAQNNNGLFVGGVGTNTFNNAGVFTRDTSSGDCYIGFNGAFNNTGTVNVQTGTLHLQSGGTSTGVFNVQGGAALDFSAGVYALSGSINGNATNSGSVIQIGGSGAAGLFTITGNYTQGASGTLAVELGGTGAAQFDKLAIGGTASLDGTLAASLINGFTPASGAQFQVLTAATRTGTFGSVNGPLAAQYNPTNVTLAAGAQTFVWDAGGGADTNWFTAANWSPDGVPGASDIALLNTNATINLPNISNAAVAAFQQTAGTLTGGGSLMIGLAFNWSGGTMSGAGSTILDTGSTLTLSGLGMTLSRSLISNGTVNWTGGNVAGVGTFSNNGIFNASAGALFSPTLTNAIGATFNQVSGTDGFQGGFNNNGIVNVIANGGVLNLGGAGTSTHTGTFNVEATLNLVAGTHLLNGAKINGAGDVGLTATAITFDSTAIYNVNGTTTVSGGTVTFNSSNLVLFGTLNQSGGTLTGVANFRVNTARHVERRNDERSGRDDR